MLVARELMGCAPSASARDTREANRLAGVFIDAAEGLKRTMRFTEADFGAARGGDAPRLAALLARCKEQSSALRTAIVAADTSEWGEQYSAIESELKACVRILKSQAATAASQAQLADVKRMWILIKARQRDARQPPPVVQRWSTYDEIVAVRNDDVGPSLFECTLLVAEIWPVSLLPYPFHAAHPCAAPSRAAFGRANCRS